MKKVCAKRIVWIVAAIGWTWFIWSNSLQTAAESSETSQGILTMVMPLLGQTGIPEEFWHTVIRKAAHMAEFALLGILWFAGLYRQGGETGCLVWKRLGLVLILCLVTAAVDEIIQLFVPGRSGELRDVCIDVSGAFLGSGLFWAVFGRKRSWNFRMRVRI